MLIVFSLDGCIDLLLYFHVLPFNISREWTFRDRLMLTVLVVLSCILLLSGLSIRSLWGSEGRWAVVAREMIQSGNYFLPTINGEVYFDKPLFSYWAIIPFALHGGVTEAAARMPSAIAGIMTIVLVFVTGRTLFGTATGFLSGMLLLTSFMFTFWSKTASGEILNLLGVWFILWIFLSGGCAGRAGHVVTIYCVGALVAFCKGPVAPAVAFSVMFVTCAWNVFIELKKEGLSGSVLQKNLYEQFRWILSWQGGVGICAGALLFLVVLLLPVIVTGSWDSVMLMWRENVLRFVRPFDHVEPPYAYVKHTLVFFLPWSLLLVASLWQMHGKEYEWQYRWVIITAITIFLFFTISGSRRSYYILPLLPALALITGRALSQWFGNEALTRKRAMKVAVITTGIVPVLVGVAMVYAYFKGDMARHVSQVIAGPIIAAGGLITALWFWKNKFRQGLGLLFILILILELWTFTIGMAIAEEKRTLRPFASALSKELARVDDSTIALFKVSSSSLIFYLNRPGPLKYMNTDKDVKNFLSMHPEGFIITEGVFLDELREYLGSVSAVPLYYQGQEKKGDQESSFVLLKYEHGDFADENGDITMEETE